MIIKASSCFSQAFKFQVRLFLLRHVSFVFYFFILCVFRSTSQETVAVMAETDSVLSFDISFSFYIFVYFQWPFGFSKAIKMRTHSSKFGDAIPVVKSIGG